MPFVGLFESIEGSHDRRAKLQLLEEQLNISKEWIKTSDVSIRKEIEKEEINITVPVNREVLIIEKKTIHEDSETIRIPISEERVEVMKHSIVLNDISIFRHQFEEIKSFEESFKKEKLHLETKGDPKVINSEK